MRTLKELLPTKKIVVPQEIDEKTLFHICKRVLVEEYGIRGGENIIPTFYKEKKLFLSPRSSLWASEVFLRRKYLCDRINEIIGKEEVREVKVNKQI